MSKAQRPRSFRLASAMVALLGLAIAAQAHAESSPAQARGRMMETAKRVAIPHYERKLANGTQRVYLNPQGHHIPAMEQALPKGSALFISEKLAAPHPITGEAMTERYHIGEKTGD